jgi:hypothetical protein
VQVDVLVNGDDQAQCRGSPPSAAGILRIVSLTWLFSSQASSLSSALASPERPPSCIQCGHASLSSFLQLFSRQKRPLLFICANSLADQELRPLHFAQSPTAAQRLGFQIAVSTDVQLAVSVASAGRTARWLLWTLRRLGAAPIDSAAFSYQWVWFKFALSLTVLSLAFNFVLGLTVLESSSLTVSIAPHKNRSGALLAALCGDQTKSNLGRQQQDRRLSPSLFGNVGGKVLGFLAAQ